MRIIALQAFQPLRDVIGSRQLMFAIERPLATAAPIAKLAPDDIAEPIGMIKEAFLKDFLMQARAIEAGRDTQFNVFNQRGIARRRHDAVRVIALVEHQTLENRLPIDLDR